MDTSDADPHFGINSQYICGWIECGLEFGQIRDLSEHIDIVHVGKKAAVYQCLWKPCDRRDPWPSRSALIAHVRKHTGDRPFMCNVCQKHFARSDALAKHVKAHNAVANATVKKPVFSNEAMAPNAEPLQRYLSLLASERTALNHQLACTQTKIRRIRATKLLILNRLLGLEQFSHV